MSHSLSSANVFLHLRARHYFVTILDPASVTKGIVVRNRRKDEIRHSSSETLPVTSSGPSCMRDKKHRAIQLDMLREGLSDTQRALCSSRDSYGKTTEPIPGDRFESPQFFYCSQKKKWTKYVPDRIFKNIGITNEINNYYFRAFACGY